MNYRPIIFHHIPKAAGTYVRLRVAEAAEGKAVVVRSAHLDNPSYRPPLLRGTIDRMSRENVSIVTSHWAFRNYTPVKGELYITWFRNPIDLFYSAWNFYRSIMTPKTLLDLFKPLRAQITGLCQCENFDAYLSAALGGMNVYPQLQFNLDWKAFDFIGFAERMQPCLSKLSSVLGIQIKCPRKKVHVTVASPMAVQHSYRRKEVAALLCSELEVFERTLEERGCGKTEKVFGKVLVCNSKVVIV